MSEELRLTAYHEAGHAVVMYVLGHVPTVATIEPNEGRGSLGHASHLYADGLFEGDEAAVIDYAASCFAGELATIRAGGDREAAALHAASDHEDAADELRRLPTDETARARERAARILEERWPAVEAVADALLYLRTIDMDEISSLADGEWTLRDCVALRLKWGGVRGPVPEDARERFGL